MNEKRESENAAFDQLRTGERIKGQSRLIADGAKPDAVTPALAGEVITALKAYQQRVGLKWKEVARSVGLSSTIVSSLVTGRLQGHWQEHIIDLDKWLEDELKREQTVRPVDFITTRLAETIFTVAGVASSLKGIGLVYGCAGIGKTMALRAVAAEKPGAVFVSMKTSTATPMGVLQAIAAGIGLRDSYNDNQGALTLRLEQLLRGTARLILIDEIHKLCGSKDDKALHVLRDLYDATGAPMLWCGTIDLVRYLERRQADGREPLAQIRSRICVVRDLADSAGTGGGDDGGDALYSIEEIRRVCGRGKMRLAPDAARYLFKLANIPDSGALRTCQNLVIIATKINVAQSDVLTLAMLQAAHQLLVSRRDLPRCREA